MTAAGPSTASTPWNPPGPWPLLTDRLALRPIEARDAAALVAYRSIPAMTRFVPFDPQDESEILRRVRDVWNRRGPEGGSVQLVVEHEAAVIGDVVVFWHAEADGAPEHGNAEIGWMLHPEHGGRGYAAEAARAALGYGFGTLGLRRISARIDAENEASARLAERIGMRLEAHLVENEFFKGRYGDELDFAMLAREWTG